MYTKVWKPPSAFQDRAPATEWNLEFYFRKIMLFFSGTIKLVLFVALRMCKRFLSEGLIEMLIEGTIF